MAPPQSRTPIRKPSQSQPQKDKQQKENQKQTRTRRRYKNNTVRACQYCQSKHLRCNEETPCGPCKLAGVECDRTWTWVNTVKIGWAGASGRRRRGTDANARMRKDGERVIERIWDPAREDVGDENENERANVGRRRDTTARRETDIPEPSIEQVFEAEHEREREREREREPEAAEQEETEPEVDDYDYDSDDSHYSDEAHILSLPKTTTPNRHKSQPTSHEIRVKIPHLPAHRPIKTEPNDIASIGLLWTETLTTKEPMYLLSEPLDSQLGWCGGTGDNDSPASTEDSPAGGDGLVLEREVSYSDVRDGRDRYISIWGNYNPLCI